MWSTPAHLHPDEHIRATVSPPHHGCVAAGATGGAAGALLSGATNHTTSGVPPGQIINSPAKGVLGLPLPAPRRHEPVAAPAHFGVSVSTLPRRRECWPPSPWRGDKIEVLQALPPGGSIGRWTSPRGVSPAAKSGLRRFRWVWWRSPRRRGLPWPQTAQPTLMLGSTRRSAQAWASPGPGAPWQQWSGGLDRWNPSRSLAPW